ncbi:SDR family oxidoreductase [Brevundimonas sp. 2R-24]|uniref:SDR family oxidoreductase n=1 Tax=Peiella sedimenti TaxID=3061083 RepID=A0ABT8SND0_9CAUL|nr:SDR family oxidoreductase [Caulobacteraceae bacterium XZ-24]
MADRRHADNATPDADEKAVVERQRDIQRPIDRSDRKQDEDGGSGAMQAGARKYPEPPFPEQHQAKPGLEARLKPEPLYDAPHWKGSGKLEGMAALITGADSGIGRAVAVLFAREGCDVAIAYLSSEEDAKTTKAAVEKEGRKAILLAGDIADPAFAKEAVKQTLDAFGRLDVLVNNAAYQQHVGDLMELSEDQFDLTMKTNLYGMFHMIKAALPHMKPGSSIINTGSITGIDGNKQLLDYSLTKGGIHAFTRALSGSLLEKGIRVNCVAPGPVWTPLNPADRDPEGVSEFGSSAKMKRPAQPEELAPAYVFLASPQSGSYITGEILPVIGGY